MIVVFGLLLQLAFIGAALKFFSDRFVYFSAASVFLSVVVLVWIINDNTNPYYKLAWIIPVMLIPFFGMATYLFAKLELG